MKKAIIFILVLMMALSFAACAKEDEDNSKDSDKKDKDKTEQNTPVPTKPEKTVKENKGTFDGDLNALGVKFEKDGWTYSYTSGGLKAEYAQDGDSTPAANYTSVNDIPVVWVNFGMHNGDKLELSNVLITSSVTNTSQMFHLVEAKELDLSGFDTKNVTTMASMFAGCKPEKFVLGDFDTSNVTNMKGMFSSFHSETKLDLSVFNTAKVTDMTSMFQKTSVKELDLSSFNTSNVTSMENMFVQAWIDAPLDLTNFDTSKVENMEKMFSGFHGVSIDISSFDFSSVTNGDRMITASEDYPLTVYVKDEAMIEKIKELDPTSSFQYVTFVVKKDK